MAVPAPPLQGPRYGVVSMCVGERAAALYCAAVGEGPVPRLHCSAAASGLRRGTRAHHTGICECLPSRPPPCTGSGMGAAAVFEFNGNGAAKAEAAKA